MSSENGNSVADIYELRRLREDASAMDLGRYRTALRRRWRQLILTPLIFCVAGVAVASATSERYRAEAAVVLRSNSTENIFLPTNATPGDADRTLQTEAEIAKSARIQIPVEAAIGKPATYSVTPVFKADVLEFSSSSSDASRAANVANAAAKTYVDERRKDAVADAQNALGAVNNAAQQVRTEITATNALPRVVTGTTELDPSVVARLNALHTQLAAFESQASELQIKASVASGGAQLIAEAQVPESPSSTSPVALGALGALLGLVVGALSALALERFSDKVEDTDDLESSSGGLAVLGEIPPLDEDTPLPIRDAPNSIPAEAIRRLRASLHLGLEDGVRTVQITSPRKGDGATMVAANLATAYAAVGHRVVIIDADMREGRLHEILGVNATRGLSNALWKPSDAGDFISTVSGFGWLAVLPAGPRPANPGELLSSSLLTPLLDQLANTCDIVIIDTPPTLDYADAVVVSRSVDAVVVVASAGRSGRRDVHSSLRALSRAHLPLAGVVLTTEVPEMAPHASNQGSKRKVK